MSDLTHRENLSLGDISMNSFVSAIRKGQGDFIYKNNYGSDDKHKGEIELCD